jgi:hypothetical protein
LGSRPQPYSQVRTGGTAVFTPPASSDACAVKQRLDPVTDRRTVDGAAHALKLDAHTLRVDGRAAGSWIRDVSGLLVEQTRNALVLANLAVRYKERRPSASDGDKDYQPQSPPQRAQKVGGASSCSSSIGDTIVPQMP